MTFLLRPFLFRWLKRTGIFIVILLVAYGVGRPVHKWLDGFYTGQRGPYLQMPAPDAITIRWQSEDESLGVVRYGVLPEQLNQVIQESEAVEEHELRLTDLKPATKYYYSIGTKSSVIYQGRDFNFKTAPVTGKTTPVRFWVTGDQGYPNEIQDQVRNAALSWTKQNPRSSANSPLFDFWLTTGDNAYKSGSNPQFQAGFFEPYKHILRNTPAWPGYGNHDSRRWVFFDLFTFPTMAESGGLASGTEHYYSFDYANIHFVMLDTQESDHDSDSKMLSWLKKDLQQNKQQWLIAIFHHPPYTKGSHNSDNQGDSGGRLFTVRESILPVLEAAGVDVVLSGHSHMYERSHLINCHYGLSDTFNKTLIRSDSKNSVYDKHANKLMPYTGAVYAVIGSSSKVDIGPLDHPAMPFSFQEAGSMVFDVNKNNLKAYFVNKEAKVLDKFEITKGKKAGIKTRLCK